jgi:hypothetical protein
MTRREAGSCGRRLSKKTEYRIQKTGDRRWNDGMKRTVQGTQDTGHGKYRQRGKAGAITKARKKRGVI